ncbi:MAG TPA: hypothetical protein VMD97_12290 [Candidatus Aquilonibacter sp.]|nr:hypothetical protein [Candidatus Aquilonibacter sp.]
MKLFDDQDLIAYHMHELSPQRKRALEQALEADPALAAESEAYAATLRAFKPGSTLPIDDHVLERNWRTLRASLAPYRIRPSASRWWGLTALTGAGLALAATSFFIAKHYHDSGRHPRIVSRHPVGDRPLPVPSFEGPLTPSAPLDVPITEAQGHFPKERYSVSPFPLSSNDGLQDLPPHRIAAPLLAERPSVLHFIPLAPGSSPPLPEPIPLSITVGPPAGQTIGRTSSLKSKSARNSTHHEYPSDLTLAMGGTLIGTRDAGSAGTGTSSEGATHAVSALAAFHQQLRPAVGYRIAFSYTRPDFLYNYVAPGTTGSQIDIDGRVFEVAGTYVIQGPHTQRLSTAVEAGGGLMGFETNTQNSYTSSNIRGAAVAGVSAEIALTKEIAIHAAFRAQAFKGPDFHYSGNAIPLSTATLFSKEPMVGITFRFSAR